MPRAGKLSEHAWKAELKKAITASDKTAALALLEATVGVPLDEPLAGGLTPLQLACQFNEEADVAVALIRAKASVATANAQGRAPLHIAAFGNSISLVTCLLEYGADPNAADARRCTPLMVAAGNNAVASAKALLDAGANKHACDKARRSPSDYAAEHRAMLHLLEGVDPGRKHGLREAEGGSGSPEPSSKGKLRVAPAPEERRRDVPKLDDSACCALI